MRLWIWMDVELYLGCMHINRRILKIQKVVFLEETLCKSNYGQI